MTKPGHTKIKADQNIPMDARPVVIERAVSDWISRHPNLTVKTLLPILAHGATVSVHIRWTN